MALRERLVHDGDRRAADAEAPLDGALVERGGLVEGEVAEEARGVDGAAPGVEEALAGLRRRPVDVLGLERVEERLARDGPGDEVVPAPAVDVRVELGEVRAGGSEAREEDEDGRPVLNPNRFKIPST